MPTDSLQQTNEAVRARVARVHARCESLLDSLADHRHPILEAA